MVNSRSSIILLAFIVFGLLNVGAAVAAGNIDWIRQFGGFEPKDATLYAVDIYDSMYVAGDSRAVLQNDTVVRDGDAYIRKYDSSGNEIWTRQFGTIGNDDASGIFVDSSGVYVVGSTQGTLPGQTKTATMSDAFVRKYDVNGNELWTRQFGAGYQCHAKAISGDSSGIYIVGMVYNGAFPGQSSGGNWDVFVRKYDANGNVILTRQFGSSQSDEAYTISVDSSGVYVAGGTWGTIPGQTRVGGLYDPDAFIRKYDSSGNEIWTRQFGTINEDRAATVSAESSGIYVAGYSAGTLPGQTEPYGAFIRKYDSSGNEIWTRQFRDAYIKSSSLDSSGVYVAGMVNGVLPNQTSIGSSDAFVRKYDFSGNEIWTKQFGTADQDSANRISVDSAGIYVGGMTQGTFPNQTRSGPYVWESFVRKYDFDANEVWTRQFGGFGPSEDNARDVDAKGNIYVVGVTTGAFPNQTDMGGTEAFIRKYDSIGSEIWTRQFGTSYSDRINGVYVVLPYVYVVGVTSGAFPNQTNAGEQDAFVRKYDEDGNELWTRQFGTSMWEFMDAKGLFADSSGVYVAAYTTGVFPGQTSAGGPPDAFVRKYDTNGNEAWTRQFGTSGDDRASAISGDSSGIYVAGSTTGTFPGQTSAGSVDAFVRKYDLSGNEVWTRQFGTSSHDFTSGVSVDSSSIYVAGNTGGTFPGQTRAGGDDAFVRKYDSDGNAIWTSQFGTSASDSAGGISVDSSGIYVAGYTYGTFPGQTSAGSVDAFVRKYDSDGNAIWTSQFGTYSSDSAGGISVDSNGVYVAGWTYGNLSGYGVNGDAFLIKFSLDQESPSSSFSFPDSGQILTVAEFTAGQDGSSGTADDSSALGTAADDVSGVASEAVATLRLADMLYYDGSYFTSEAPIYNSADVTAGQGTTTASWQYYIDVTPFEDFSFDMSARATDVAGNIESTAKRKFTIFKDSGNDGIQDSIQTSTTTFSYSGTDGFGVNGARIAKRYIDGVADGVRAWGASGARKFSVCAAAQVDISMDANNAVERARCSAASAAVNTWAGTDNSGKVSTTGKRAYGWVAPWKAELNADAQLTATKGSTVFKTENKAVNVTLYTDDTFTSMFAKLEMPIYAEVKLQATADAKYAVMVIGGSALVRGADGSTATLYSGVIAIVNPTTGNVQQCYDCDNDGVDNNNEIQFGTDPLNPASYPVQLSLYTKAHVMVQVWQKPPYVQRNPLISSYLTFDKPVWVCDWGCYKTTNTWSWGQTWIVVPSDYGTLKIEASSTLMVAKNYRTFTGRDSEDLTKLPKYGFGYGTADIVYGVMIQLTSPWGFMSACSSEKACLKLEQNVTVADGTTTDTVLIDGNAVKVTPSNEKKITGSLLTIYEPAEIPLEETTYVPFVYDTTDDYWQIANSFTPPAGCTVDSSSQTLTVNQETKAAVFTMTCTSSAPTGAVTGMVSGKASDYAKAVHTARDCTKKGCPPQKLESSIAAIKAAKAQGKPFQTTGYVPLESASIVIGALLIICLAYFWWTRPKAGKARPKARAKRTLARK